MIRNINSLLWKPKLNVLADKFVNHIDNASVRQVRKRMIGLSVSMRCARPGSWIKVIHLPVRTRLSASQCLSLVHAWLGIHARLDRASEWESVVPRYDALCRRRSRMETSSPMMPRNLSGEASLLSRVRNVCVRAVRSGSALHATDVCSPPPVIGSK